MHARDCLVLLSLSRRNFGEFSVSVVPFRNLSSEEFLFLCRCESTMQFQLDVLSRRDAQVPIGTDHITRVVFDLRVSFRSLCSEGFLFSWRTHVIVLRGCLSVIETSANSR